MRMVGYIDGQRRFVRDDISPEELRVIAAYLQELADFSKKRVALVIERDGISHLMHAGGCS